MKLQNLRNFRFRHLNRMMKLQYLKLLRSPGGARKVAVGFAIGFGLEMLVLSTASAIYLLFYPIVRLANASLSASIIGNIIGKLTFLPITLMPFASMVGRYLLPFRPLDMPNSLYLYVKTLLGMSVFAAGLGFLSFFPAYYLYEMNRKHREAKREARREHRKLQSQCSN